MVFIELSNSVEVYIERMYVLIAADSGCQWMLLCICATMNTEGYFFEQNGVGCGI